MAAPVVLTALRKACGPDYARPAGFADAVHGASAGWVAAPGTTEEVAEVMRVAARYGLRVVTRGAGTKLNWGAPPRSVDLVVYTSRLTGIVEHPAGDLIAVVRAGTSLAALGQAVGRHQQRLALDDPTGGTVGGTIATNASGPLRLLYGTPRDLLIGITVVRPDGVVAHSGGKVVKNVAGYDLGKLFTGSYGTLGVIVEAVFRLHPLPEARLFVKRGLSSPAEADRLLQAVAQSQLVPAALELDWPMPDGPGMLALLLEGHQVGLDIRARSAEKLLESGVDVSPDPPGWWAQPVAEQHTVTIRVTYPLARLGTVLHALRTTGETYGMRTMTRGSAGAGVLHVALPLGSDPVTVREFLGDLRAALAGHGGSVVVLAAPAGVAGAVDVWGEVPGLALMQRVKDQFDPEHRCAPGRFVGGI